MLLLALFACTSPGTDDTAWKGGQTGSESAECGEETRSAVSSSERPELWERTDGSWDRVFVWDEGETEALDLVINADDEASAVETEKCGSWTELDVVVGFSLENGAFDENLSITLATDAIDTEVLQARAEVDEPAGTWEGAVSFYFAFPHPDRGPVGTVTNDEGGLGNW